MQRAYLAKRLREVGIEVSLRGQPDNGGIEQVDSQAMIQTAEHRAAVAEALNSWRGAGCKPNHLSLASTQPFSLATECTSRSERLFRTSYSLMSFFPLAHTEHTCQ